MPDHWARLSEEKQQAIIGRLTEKIRTGVDRALTILTRNEFAAVQADLKAITWEAGIKATLSIPRDALYRHQLCDAQGQKVLVVLTSADRWLTRMDEIKAKGDQADLFEEAAHIPGVDQPHYRRDRDRIAPAGPTWEDLKSSLKNAGKPADEPGTEAPAPKVDGEAPPEEPPLIFGTALTEQQERAAELTGLQECLAAIGVNVSLGSLQAQSAQQIDSTRAWCEAYAADADSCKIARPLWLPIPERKEDDAQ